MEFIVQLASVYSQVDNEEWVFHEAITTPAEEGQERSNIGLIIHKTPPKNNYVKQLAINCQFIVLIKGHLKTIILVILHTAKTFNYNACFSIFSSVEGGHMKVMKHFLELGVTFAADKDGRTNLMQASR